MRGACHRSDSAEGPHRRRDSLVIGGDDDRVDAARRGRTTIDMLDHRPAGYVCERFAGQTRGVIAGGDDGDNLWGRKCSVERILKSDRVHDES